MENKKDIIKILEDKLINLNREATMIEFLTKMTKEMLEKLKAKGKN